MKVLQVGNNEYGLLEITEADMDCILDENTEKGRRAKSITGYPLYYTASGRLFPASNGKGEIVDRS